MFHDALAPHGKWIDYGKYGPVWHPNNVSSSWRPYLDGRWVPSHAGWTFETSEPWGWATYHYGNWMPTTDYGWVWSPGSTWYPSTAAGGPATIMSAGPPSRRPIMSRRQPLPPPTIMLKPLSWITWPRPSGFS